MQTSTNVIFFRFSPENMPEEVLRQLLTGKEKFLEQQISDITQAVINKTPRYILIVGPRGIGKSHIMTLLYYEINKQLSNQLTPIKFAEEEYSIFRASDFFLRALDEKNYNTEQIKTLKDEDLILNASVDQLKFIAKEENRPYIFFIENLHMVFEQLEKRELQKLRSILQENKIFHIIASSPITFKGISEHEEPFYNFFKVKHLNELTPDETKEYMKKIAEIEGNSRFIEEFESYEKKIEGIYRLTGGSPRLIILLYEIITRGNFEDLEKIFLKMMDEYTPYYQEIFQMIPPQRRLIFDTIMTSSTPLTPKDIAYESRVDVKIVNQQLRRLETDGYVLSHPMKKRTSYEVRERLFRLWREMRKPLGKNRISIFIDFLTCWYTPEEREENFKRKFELLSAGDKSLIKEVFYFAESLPPECRVQHLHNYVEKLTELGATCEVHTTIKHLKSCVDQIQDETLKSSIYNEDGKLRFSKKEYEKALLSFETALILNPRDIEALKQKSIVLNILNQYDEAIDTINFALKIEQNNVSLLLTKAAILGSDEKFEESLEITKKAVRIDHENSRAYYLQGLALHSLEQYEESLNSLNKSLKFSPDDINTLELKGLVLECLYKLDEAIETYDEILSIDSENVDIICLKCDALIVSDKILDAYETINQALEFDSINFKLLIMKGQILFYLEQYENAITIFDTILEYYQNNEEALIWKGILLNCIQKNDKALEIFDELVLINPNNSYYIYSKSFTLNRLKRPDEAIETIDEGLIKFPDNVSLLQEKAVSCCELKQNERALEISNYTIKLEPNNNRTLQLRGLILTYIGDIHEALDTINKALDIEPENKVSMFIKSSILSAMDMHVEALDLINKVIEKDPSPIYINRKIRYLLKLGNFEEVINIVKTIPKSNDYYDYSNAFSIALIEAYIKKGENPLAIIEIEKLKDNIKNSDDADIMRFSKNIFELANSEFKSGNHENGKKLLRYVYHIEEQCPDKDLDIKALTIDFLKELIDYGDIHVIDSVIEQIISCKGDEYRWFIKPLTDALEIIKTKDVRIYYRDLQVEEREVVAEIVKKITKKEDLLPQNFT